MEMDGENQLESQGDEGAPDSWREEGEYEFPTFRPAGVFVGVT